MKSILKKGFTLTELLLCVAIISIVTAVGGSIAKHSAEKAYNNYFFYGFANLYDATMHIERKDIEDSYKGADTLEHYATKLNTIFNENTKSAIPSEDKTTWTVNTSNGIKYEISELSSGTGYEIQMYVPALKTRNTPNSYKRTRIIYIRSGENSGIMFPSALSTETYDVDLQNNILLLPTYINRGERQIKEDNGQIRIIPIRYYSYHDAYCILSAGGNTSLEENGTTYIDCDSFTTPTGENNNPGIIQFANPSKIRL